MLICYERKHCSAEKYCSEEQEHDVGGVVADRGVDWTQTRRKSVWRETTELCYASTDRSIVQTIASNSEG
jgi:hypothetical protein